MKTSYDRYYQTENLFGAPYPELIAFFTNCPKRGKLLDLGCGQGRDAIPLARMGYEVTGVDISQVGIEQMMEKAKPEELPLRGIVADIYLYDDFSGFNFILLDSMFHFTKKDKVKETGLIKRILKNAVPGTLICFCLQHTGNKAMILKEAIGKQDIVAEEDFLYKFVDRQSGHRSSTPYKMIVIRLLLPAERVSRAV